MNEDMDLDPELTSVNQPNPHHQLMRTDETHEGGEPLYLLCVKVSANHYDDILRLGTLFQIVPHAVQYERLLGGHVDAHIENNIIDRLIDEQEWTNGHNSYYLIPWELSDNDNDTLGEFVTYPEGMPDGLHGRYIIMLSQSQDFPVWADATNYEDAVERYQEIVPQIDDAREQGTHHAQDVIKLYHIDPTNNHVEMIEQY
jgi:hypothetical protein